MPRPDLDRHSQFNMSLHFLNMISEQLYMADIELMNLRQNPYRANPLLNILEVIFMKVMGLVKQDDRDKFLDRLDNARNKIQLELKKINDQAEREDNEDEQAWQKTISYPLYMELRSLYLDIMDVINTHSLGLKSEVMNDESKESRLKRGLKLG